MNGLVADFILMFLILPEDFQQTAGVKTAEAAPNGNIPTQKEF